MVLLRRLLGVPLVVALALQCAPPTDLTVTVYSEVPCAKGSPVVLVGGSSVTELPSRTTSSVSTECLDDGRMGSVVVVPATSTDETVVFALMQRADGQPADGCLDPAQASGCIVAKRQLRFQSHNESDMRVDLRLSCLGVTCPVDQTCVEGGCVDVVTCGAACDNGPTQDGGPPPPPPPPPPVDGLLGLTVSAGTLSPAFNQSALSYAVQASVTSLGMPFTVTPTYTTGYSVTINGSPVASGAASPVIALGLQAPTPVDVAVTSADGGAPAHYAVVVPPVQEAYAKASVASPGVFGWAVALSGDTLAVGAQYESSNASGINGNPNDNSSTDSGAAYVFTRSGTTWSQQAYIKASNNQLYAYFGSSIALSGDTLAVGAVLESSNATGINGNGADTSMMNAGAAYVFTRSGTTWSQQAYVKASNTRPDGYFGMAIAVDSDTLAVGSSGESSSATGIDGTQSDTSMAFAGATYVFTRSGTTWSQQAYIKASNTRATAHFGNDVALAGDTLAVGSIFESSNATGIGGNQADASMNNAGAAYVFKRTGTTWSQQAYVKASNTAAGAEFGCSVALSGDTLAVGAQVDASAASGINGNQGDTSAPGAGAAYVFTRTGTTWAQQAYVKASNPLTNTYFGGSVALVGDTLAIGSPNETSNATGVDGNQADQSLTGAGAVYLFSRSGATWSQYAYVKASNSRSNAEFGGSITLTADTLAVGAWGESSNATGINGNEADTSQGYGGAVYVLR